MPGLCLQCCRSTWIRNAVAISKPLWPWSRSFFPPSSLHSTVITLPATNTQHNNMDWCLLLCRRISVAYKMMLDLFLCRPDHAVVNGEDGDHLNFRDLTDEPWRRQVIANLAKHVLFSKRPMKPWYIWFFYAHFLCKRSWVPTRRTRVLF